MHCYIAFARLDADTKLVHLKATSRLTPAQFVAVRRRSVTEVKAQQERLPQGSRYFVSAPSCEKEVVEQILANLNRCDASQIEIKFDSALWLTVGVADQEIAPNRWELMAHEVRQGR